jgi:capsular exopolysaccharide synthesis family protein
MVTSSMRGEGKTTIASNLAISLSRKKDRRVVLVDADLRRPQVHVLFGFARSNGLAEILEGKLDIGAAYRSTTLDNLMVITGGQYRRSPSKLFENNNFGDIIENLKTSFEIVICDFPPTIPVSEPEMVSKLVDGVLFVFLAGKTPREVGQRGIAILQESEANILGVVVNDLSEVLPYHYRYKYYKYYTTKPDIKLQKKR